MKQLLIVVFIAGLSTAAALQNTNNNFIYRNRGFEAFTLPGISNAWPRAINNSGDVTGFIVGSNDCFVTRGSSVERFKVPETDKCSPHGINDSGTVVGWYLSPHGDFGFMKRGPTFTSIRIEGCFSTDAMGINTKGQVVGSCNRSGSQGSVGYLRNVDGTATFIAPPDATSVFPMGIDDSGRIVGHYYARTAPSSHSFLYSNGFFKELNVPGCDEVDAKAISPHGLITGDCVDLTKPGKPSRRGFIVNADSWSSKTIAAPNALISPEGINDQGDLVGYWSPQ